MNQKKTSSRKSRKQALRENQAKSKRGLYIGLAVAAIVIVAAVLIATLPGNTKVNLLEPEVITRSQVDGLTAGDPNAKVVVEEFSDFGCGGCMTFATKSEKAIVDTYINTGKVYFKYSPTTWHDHQGTGTGAMTAYCANEQGIFWEMHDLLFANFGAPVTENFLKSAAAMLKMDGAALVKCVSSNKYAEQIQKDLQRAQDTKIEYTPSFVVNGKVVGSDTLIATIEEALKQ